MISPAAQIYHLSQCKHAARSSNLNSKSCSLNQNAENMKTAKPALFCLIFKPEIEDAHEQKHVAKCQINNLAVGWFRSSQAEL